MQKLKIAQIGTGHGHAAGIMQTVKKLNHLFDIVSIAEPNEALCEQAKNLPEYSGLIWCTVEELLNTPSLDGVLIETEESKLVYYAQKAIDANLPVHMDKPGGENHAEFNNLIETARRKSLPLHMGYMYRYNPAVEQCLKWLHEGKFGTIFSIDAQMSVKLDRTAREWLKNFQGGMMYYLGCHMLDLIFAFQGFPDKIIPLNCSNNIEQVNSKDFGMVVLQYKNGVSFVKSNANEINGFSRRQLVICGTNGTAEIQPVESYDPADCSILKTRLKATFKEHTANPYFDYSKTFTYPAYGRYDKMMQSFYEILRHEKNNPYSYNYEKKLHRLILRACNIEL